MSAGKPLGVVLAGTAALGPHNALQMLHLFPDMLFSVSGGGAILATDAWAAQAFNASILHLPDIPPFVAVESELRR
ncbi:hypothetical protein HPB51_013429 [Rhipicephalus microplus]|uniref:Uncharacterized protein n=1 Tax=Rhipicephalus microplus TaxID=6941 RepID=A0A9J6D5B3_RHIMP|nr:hypothetical protein HPB51_013429 [Rhipicephalus microplus]